MEHGRTYAQIDLGAISHNIKCIKKHIPEGVKLLTVIKADAYGHGAVEVAKALCNKCDFFGVAGIAEGVELRKAGIETPILVLGCTDAHEFMSAVEYAIRPTIFTMEQAKALSDEAVRQGRTAACHIAIDTGMSRIGFQVTEDSADIVAAITRLPSVQVEGLFSHYFASDEADLSRAVTQRAEFDRFVRMLDERRISIPIKHICNSAGIMNFSDCLDMVRSGIITYGVFPSHEVDTSTLDLRPALEWKSHVFHVKTLEAGRYVGYGGSYVTERETVVATVSVGYADGYPWCLSNKGRVIIHGQYAPIIGRVCMDILMVDVTHIPDVRDGDVVTLIGREGNAVLTVDEVAEAAHSFNYELLCGLARRVPRVYIRNECEVAVVDYLGNP